MIKTLREPGIKGNFFNLVKSFYKNSTAVIILTGEELNAFLPRLETMQEYFFFSPLLLNIVLKILANVTGKENNIHSGKKKVKLLLFADVRIPRNLYKNP